ncbi:MAG: dUTP diphosphatase [Lachnospiraceae bacterium]|nr:dUTP diphosphatase [Lachnospiraceae bacterium]
MSLIHVLEEIVTNYGVGLKDSNSEYTLTKPVSISLDQKVLVKKLHPDAVIPKYAKPGDAGFDLFAVEETVVMPGQTVIIKTGLAVAVPEGFEMQVRMRSGASLRTPLIVANAPGTVDSGYRGEVGIIVRNVHPTLPYTVHKGGRIAQGVIAPVVTAEFTEVDELPDSERGSGGFGSTGSN